MAKLKDDDNRVSYIVNPDIYLIMHTFMNEHGYAENYVIGWANSEEHAEAICEELNVDIPRCPFAEDEMPKFMEAHRQWLMLAKELEAPQTLNNEEKIEFIKKQREIWFQSKATPFKVEPYTLQRYDEWDEYNQSYVYPVFYQKISRVNKDEWAGSFDKEIELRK